MKIFIAFLLCCGAFSLYSCTQGEQIMVPETAEIQYSKAAPLLCLAKSLAEAEKIAADYGISLVEFKAGVASFYTDKNPKDVIKWGEEKGLTPLDINTTSHIFNSTDE